MTYIRTCTYLRKHNITGLIDYLVIILPVTHSIRKYSYGFCYLCHLLSIGRRNFYVSVSACVAVAKLSSFCCSDQLLLSLSPLRSKRMRASQVATATHADTKTEIPPTYAQ